MFVLAVLLSLSAWHGGDLPTSAASAVKYRLTVAGTPGSVVRVRATHVAPGWIAAFCDPRVCSPRHVSEPIPPSGKAVVQFELIREDPQARASGAVIESESAKSVIVPAVEPH